MLNSACFCLTDMKIVDRSRCADRDLPGDAGCTYRNRIVPAFMHGCIACLMVWALLSDDEVSAEIVLTMQVVLIEIVLCQRLHVFITFSELFLRVCVCVCAFVYNSKDS